jgi:hypothetical protein
LGPDNQVLARVPVYAGYWFVFQDQLPERANRMITLDLPPRPIGRIETRPIANPTEPLAEPFPEPPISAVANQPPIVFNRQPSSKVSQPKQPVTFGKLRFPPLPKPDKPKNMTPSQEAGLEKMPGQLTEIERRRLAAQKAATKKAENGNFTSENAKKNILKPPPSEFTRNPDESMVQQTEKPKRPNISGKGH